MIVGFMIGQRTPGHSTAEAVAFEERIHQRYVDHIAEAGWDYLGVYAVDGLVPGAFAEVVVVDAPDPAEALRRDEEHEASGVPDDVAAFYAECRDLFWQRGRLAWWLLPAPGRRIPLRGEALRLTVCESGADGALPVHPWREGEAAPAPAIRVDVLGPERVAPDDHPLDAAVPALPADLAAALTLVLRPLVPAPERSPTAPAAT